MKYCNNLRAISDIVDKINRARKEKYFVEKCDKAFGSLETIFDLYIDYAIKTNSLSDFAKQQLENSRTGQLSKNAKLSETVNSLLTPSQKKSFLQSKVFKNILHFRPFIMSDEILEENRYNPYNISNELRKDASLTHRKLLDTYNRNYRYERIIGALCKLIYEVRNNLKHFGKTPYGPDEEKSNRDELICQLVYPILLLFFEYFLNFPNNKLIVYGTLMRNKINNNFIEEINAEYQKINIWGYIEHINDLPYYTFSISNKETIEAELITNVDLKDKFDKLDRFEGNSYRRILVPFKIDNNILVGNIYEKNSA